MKNYSAAFVIILGALASLCSCTNSGSNSNNKNGITYLVKGTIKGMDSGWVVLAYMKGDKYIYDTVKVNEGTFTTTGSTEYPQVGYLRVLEDLAYDGTDFFLENSEINISAVKDSLSHAIVTGSATNEEYTKYKDQMKPFVDRLDIINNAYQMANSRNDKKATDSLGKMYDAVDNERIAEVKKYISSHPASYVAASEIMNVYAYNPRISEFDSAYNSLNSSIKESAAGKRIFAMLETAKKTDIGHAAPDFTLNDINGKPLALSSFKGKYILVDFWASWCGPCRAENPEVVKAYADYHPKGFDILGVSLDTKKDKWLKAIGDDKLAWTHVSELKGWESGICSLYGIRSIPMNFLLDKNGIIVAKGLRGDDLEKKLAEVVKQ